MIKDRFSKPNCILILALVTCLVYANTLQNGFAYDDLSAITRNTLVSQGISSVPRLLVTPYRWGFHTTTNDLYRPLSLVMFAAEYQLFGGSASPMHAVNVLLFVACVVLLFIFLSRLFGDTCRFTAFIAALLFAVHPVHTEVVANIKSRDELLCFLFAFTCLNMFLKYVATGRAFSLAAGLVCLFLSLLSKETSVSLIALIPLISFVYSRGHRRRSVALTLTSIGVIACYLLLRYQVLHTHGTDHVADIRFMDNFLVQPPDMASGFATRILILGRYLALCFIPWPLICDYSFHAIPFVAPGSIWVLLSAAVYVFLILFVIVRIAKKGDDPLAFGIALFLITLALFSNLFILTGAAMAERFLFFPSAGFCWAIALLIARLVKRADTAVTAVRGRQWIIAAPVAAVFSIATMVRNSDWKDSLTLFTADATKAPENARLQFFVANEMLIRNEDTDASIRSASATEALAHLNRALKVYPKYDDAHRAAGNACFFLGQPDSAILHYNEAIHLNPGDIEAMNNLNVLYFSLQRFSDAIVICRKITALQPCYAEGYNDIGICYMHLQKYDSAIYTLRTAARANPEFNPFYENLALAWKLANIPDSARHYEVLARQRNPGFSVF